jgi:hypothetical protein
MAKLILIHMNAPSPHRSKATLTDMRDFLFQSTSPFILIESIVIEFPFSATIYRRLRGRSFEHAGEFVEAVREAASLIRHSELDIVFRNWEDRL